MITWSIPRSAPSRRRRSYLDRPQSGWEGSGREAAPTEAEQRARWVWGADTPQPTGQLHGSLRTTTLASSQLLQCILNGCRHTSPDGAVAWATPSSGLLHEPFSAWHSPGRPTPSNCPVQPAAPVHFQCTQTHLTGQLHGLPHHLDRSMSHSLHGTPLDGPPHPTFCPVGGGVYPAFLATGPPLFWAQHDRRHWGVSANRKRRCTRQCTRRNSTCRTHYATQF